MFPKKIKTFLGLTMVFNYSDGVLYYKNTKVAPSYKRGRLFLHNKFMVESCDTPQLSYPTLFIPGVQPSRDFDESYQSLNREVAEEFVTGIEKMLTVKPIPLWSKYAAKA